LAELGDQPWVMRPTGGKAVRHGYDICVAIAVPFATLSLSPRQVKRAYRSLAEPIVLALRALGVPATLVEGTKWENRRSTTDSVTGGPAKRLPPGTEDCFAYNSPNDIVNEQSGSKVCGCALRFTDSAVLVQASIPLAVLAKHRPPNDEM